MLENKNNSLPSDGYTRIMGIAKFLGMHHQSIRRWIKQGKIPAPKVINGVQLFSNAEILDWIEQSQTKHNYLKQNEGVSDE